ncbi:hypothetical protein [Allorhizocola rhizosphaerae]|uniref:hypothetical protein n=1 Tax=Allorhizocola rhizosphaerae TaxID=1872709 RepID=UPI0013C2CBB6|nr:hypothetical protein [Allorhizocola rhizosphaerae]
MPATDGSGSVPPTAGSAPLSSPVEPAPLGPSWLAAIPLIVATAATIVLSIAPQRALTLWP